MKETGSVPGHPRRLHSSPCATHSIVRTGTDLAATDPGIRLIARGARRESPIMTAMGSTSPHSKGMTQLAPFLQGHRGLRTE